MIVTEQQVSAALQHHGKLHNVTSGAPDGISLPAECSRIATLLAQMWFSREQEALVPNASRLAGLVATAFGIDEGALASQPDAHVRIVEADGGYRLVPPQQPGADSAQAGAPAPKGPPQEGGAAAPAPTQEQGDAFETMELRACPLRNNGDEVCDVCQ